MRAGSAALSIDLALKAVLVGLLIFAAARQDLPQFHGKSMTGRAIGYPLAALVVPVGWWLLSRRRAVRFPVAVDILVVAPFAWFGRRPGYLRSESAAPTARSAMPRSRGQ
jgi:hypothetical protein